MEPDCRCGPWDKVVSCNVNDSCVLMQVYVTKQASEKTCQDQAIKPASKWGCLELLGGAGLAFVSNNQEATSNKTQDLYN